MKCSRSSLLYPVALVMNRRFSGDIGFCNLPSPNTELPSSLLHRMLTWQILGDPLQYLAASGSPFMPRRLLASHTAFEKSKICMQEKITMPPLLSQLSEARCWMAEILHACAVKQSCQNDQPLMPLPSISTVTKPSFINYLWFFESLSKLIEPQK